MFEQEKEWYYDLFISEGKNPDHYLPNGLAFYYRGSIIIDGLKVFRVTYDENEKKWKIKFFKMFQDKTPELSGSDKKLVIEANLQRLEAAEIESLEFIQKTFRKYEKMPKGVSFSGGKDSAVVLYLTRQLAPEIDVIFLNTTITYPETEKYIIKLKNEWNFNLIEVKPSRDFFTLCS